MPGDRAQAEGRVSLRLPIRPRIALHRIEGRAVVVAEVSEVALAQPCRMVAVYSPREPVWRRRMDQEIVAALEDAGIDVTFEEQFPRVGIQVDGDGRIVPATEETALSSRARRSPL